MANIHNKFVQAGSGDPTKAKYVGIPFNYSRGSAVPLDETSYFDSLSSAEDYAKTGSVAYIGQILTVVDGAQEYSEWNFGETESTYVVTEADGKLYINGIAATLASNLLSLEAKIEGVTVVATRTIVKKANVSQYQIVDTAGTIEKVGDTESLNPVISALSDAIDVNASNISTLDQKVDSSVSALSTAISVNIDAISELSGAIDDHTDEISALSAKVGEIQGAVLGDLADISALLAENLVVDVVEETAEDGALKTYSITQGGESVGKINIPKDFLVKSATVETCKVADTPVVGYKVGDKYLDFVINSKDADDAATEQHLYVLVTDLIDVYTAGDTTTINMELVDNQFTAEIIDGAVNTKHLANEAVTEAKLSADAVTSVKIKDGAVVEGKLADGAVTTVKIADDSITSSKLATDSVTDVKIAAGAITTGKIADGNVTKAKLNGDVFAEISAIADAEAREVVAELSGNIVDKAVADAKADTAISVGQLQTAITTTVANAKTELSGFVNTKVNDLSTEVITKITGLESANTDLQNAINTEKSEREAADQNLQTSIDGVSTNLGLSVETLNAAIAKEVSDRETAVNGLQDGLNAEAEARANADEFLSGAIDDEVAARAAGDEYLSGAIYAICANYATKEELADEAEILSNLISAETTAREGAITALTERLDKIGGELAGDYAKLSDLNQVSSDLDDLEANVETISSDLDGLKANVETISSDLDDLEATVNTVSSDYLKASDFNAISTAIGLDRASAENKVVVSSDLTAAVADLAGAMHFAGVKDELPSTIDGYKSGDVIIISGTSKEYICDGEKWVELGYENLYATDGELQQEITARTTADAYLSGAIYAICANYATKEELASETTARSTADAALSTAIDNKVFVNDVSASTLNIKNISQAAYHEIVNSTEGADPNTVYIVSAEGAYNMYGERIVELSTTGVEGTSEAANVAYVDQAIEAATAGVVANAISAIAIGDSQFTAVNNVVTLEINVLSGGTAAG